MCKLQVGSRATTKSGVQAMFRKLLTSVSICLQGTLFERRPHKPVIREKQETWYYSLDENGAKPYLMVAEEFKVKYDLITKLHSRDGQLLNGRDSSKRGRAKWCPEQHEQVYEMTNEPGSHDPRVAVYYNALGLGYSREVNMI
jgi:hypothetical protein